MNTTNPDPNLSAPQEANTTKHINFLEIEEDAGSTSIPDNETNDEEGPTQKAWRELREEKDKNK